MNNNYAASSRNILLFALSLFICFFTVNSYAASKGINDRAAPIDRQIKVYRYTQGTQCNNDGIPLKKMADELTAAGITFTCAQRAYDGKAYATVCGGASGEINVFQIYSKDLPLVRRMGYNPVSKLPDYQDRPCGSAKVFKYDGSVQCENNAIPLEKMAEELVSGGIDVLCSQKGDDGMARAAACGIGTGAINVYSIRQENIPDAEALGFRSVQELSNYQDRQCY